MRTEKRGSEGAVKSPFVAAIVHDSDRIPRMKKRLGRNQIFT